ncbi:MAG: hypothetical protein ACRDBY_12775 [Cetobacterium sp.]
MYCRMCDKLEQDRSGRIYCSMNGRSVGLNQVCCVGNYELDKRLFEEVVQEVIENKS